MPFRHCRTGRISRLSPRGIYKGSYPKAYRVTINSIRMLTMRQKQMFETVSSFFRQIKIKRYLLIWLTVHALVIAGCASVGRDFPSDQVNQIEIGKTTQGQVRRAFGPPWRVGIEDGQETWTYGRYRYRLFGKSNTKDLVVRFNDQNIVASYSFNTTDHQE